MTTPRHRVCNIEISEEQSLLLQKYLPYGIRGKIFKQLIDDFIDELKKPTRSEFVARLLMRDIELNDIIGGKDEPE